MPKKMFRIPGEGLATTCLIIQFLLYFYPRFDFWLPSLLFRGALCIPALIALWKPKNKEPLTAKLSVSALLTVTSFSPVLFPHKVLMLLFLALLLFAVFCAAMCGIGKHKSRSALAMCMLAGMTVLGFLVQSAFTYSFMDKSVPPFLLISLVIGAVTTVFVMAKWLWKGRKFWGRVGYILVVFLCTAFLVWVGIAHLNYGLDTSETQNHILTIEDKDYNDLRKGPDHYYLVFSYEGERIRVEVPSSHYDALDIGDSYPVRFYQGAFGKAFFLSEAIPQ